MLRRRIWDTTSVTRFTALLDANVLYPAPIRDILVQLAVDDLFQAKWTADIHREWMTALLLKEPQRDRSKLERTRELMDTATRDALVEGYEALVPCLELPDPDDRHVLAAAIVGKCDVIITRNLQDFPSDTLTAFGLEAQDPDDFLSYRLVLSPDIFCEAIRKVRARLKNPPYRIAVYLDVLKRQGLIQTVTNLEPYLHLL